ncbi:MULTISPECIES: carbohydrate ABC transporter permease [Halorubrum]|uniref:Carbohydrate ABC transporter membrane protein 1, CUT1 family n=1 Tax=Halorubrum sodomense TaxID=35743 RepID=A0A1I6G8D4_HALSD|nr:MULTISPECIES: sugar ABC transporter permease [Halorubrum]TKX69434.1 sugar ABC transporter permease [Halorubrum sp. SP9]SFR38307.1 carbohydrate ABC transporter membrane protein 1, CUT1 family [Halorubrum sodomense]
MASSQLDVGGGGLSRLRSALPFSGHDWGLLLVIPGVILFSSFMLYPIVYLFYISLTDATFAGSVIGGGAELIGLANYAQLLRDPQFWSSMSTTWLFVAVSLVVKVFVAVGIALLLNHARVVGKRYMRAAVIVPLGFPGIFTITVWRGMFSDARFGVFNTVLGRYNEFMSALSAPQVLLFDVPIGFLSGRWEAFFAYVTTEVWLAYPFMVIIIVSALQDVPESLHEAAMVDGAGWLQRFRTVTLPAIKGPVLFASILTAATSFQQFLIPWVFNRGGPARQNELIIVYGYREAISFNEFGLSAAILIVAIAFVGLFMLVAVRYGGLAEGVGEQ